jgi:hypothetical protein
MAEPNTKLPVAQMLTKLRWAKSQVQQGRPRLTSPLQITARLRRTLLSLDHLYRRVFAPMLEQPCPPNVRQQINALYREVSALMVGNASRARHWPTGTFRGSTNRGSGSEWVS